jgi:hypothetical protein
LATDHPKFPQSAQYRCLRAVSTGLGVGKKVAKKYGSISWFGGCCVLILVLMLLLNGCMSKQPNLNQKLAYSVDMYPESFAILPFKNETRIDGIETFVRQTLYSHMSVLPYKDVELSLVDEKLKACGFLGYERVEDIPLDELGYLLGVDAVVFGELTEFQKVFMGIYSQMAVAVKISIWDTRSGLKVWEDECVSRNHEGGLPLGFFDLPLILVRSGYHLRETSKVRAVDDVSRQLASRIPVPPEIKNRTDQVDYTDVSDDNLQPSKLRSLKKLTRIYPGEFNGYKKKSLKRLTKR